ncbi:hypothetical protein C8Q73DRAFT_785331 [Cubamyces lactineus]|nr:hypothetical protein C8Q73DRAFT_785331 [Cubamyces lactineus]
MQIFNKVLVLVAVFVTFAAATPIAEGEAVTAAPAATPNEREAMRIVIGSPTETCRRQELAD